MLGLATGSTPTSVLVPRSTVIENLLAQRDHLAVDDPSENRLDLVCRHGDHDFVQARHTLSDADWARFRREVAAAAAEALPDPITRVDQLLIGVGKKPFATHP